MRFWNREPKVANPNEPAHRPQQASNGQNQTNLLAGTLNATNWTRVKDSPNPGLDLAMFHTGTIGVTAPHYEQTVHFQRLESTNLATDTVLVATPNDLVTIERNLWKPGDSVALSVRIGSETYTQHHANQAVVIPGQIETMAKLAGFSQDPNFTLDQMEVDLLIARSAHGIVDRTCRQLHQHGLYGGCSVFEHIGFGGCCPIGDYAIQDFAQHMTINKHHKALYLGSPYQLQNRLIARNWLAEFLAMPIPDNVLLYLINLDHPGPQSWDRALAHGFLTVTSTDRYHGQGDASNHFKRIKDNGNIVEVTPYVIKMPMVIKEKRTKFGRKEVYYVVEDSAVTPLLTALKRDIDKFDYPYRTVVFTGDFTNDEVHDLRQRAQMMAPRGQLDVIVNRCLPLTHGHTAADYYLIVFAVPDGQARSLINLADDDSLHPNGSTNMGLDELVTRLSNGNGHNGSTMADKVKKLLGTRR